MKKKLLLITVLTFAMLLLVGCVKMQNTDEEKPVIAVSIVPELEFVKAVCGEEFEVVAMIPPGNSPANYEPSPTERMKLNEANIMYAIGVPTEQNNILPYLDENTVLVQLDRYVSDAYPDRMIGNSRDPHIWLSPKRAMVMVATIRDTLIDQFPEKKELFETNANEYIGELKKLNVRISEILAEKDGFKIIVFHPAFGYLCDDYGIEMYALENEGKEPTIEHLAQMIDFAKREGIKVLFYQKEIDSSQSQAFAEEIGGKTVQLSPLAENYIDNLTLMAESIAEVIE